MSPGEDVRTASAALALFLAGLIDETEACRRLGLAAGELGPALAEHGLTDTAMTPVDVDGELNVLYRDLGRSAFDRPLFDQVAALGAGTSAGLQFQLSAGAILEPPAGMLPPAPVGLIFHVGRCGSNLLCNLLAGVSGVVVLREPELFNALFLRLGRERSQQVRDWLEALAERLLRSLAHGVRRDEGGRPRRGVVKFSSWNGLFAEPLMKRLSGAPAVVVVREPWATVASYLEEPPYWYDRGRKSRTESARYFAGNWSAVTACALGLEPERTLIVGYGELTGDPAGVLERVCRLFGIAAAPADARAALAVMSVYSKSTTGEPYDPATRRREDLDPALEELVTRITRKSWAALQERMSGVLAPGQDSVGEREGRENGRSSRI